LAFYGDLWRTAAVAILRGPRLPTPAVNGKVDELGNVGVSLCPLGDDFIKEVTRHNRSPRNR
jgi:hypothetical protein